MKKRLICVLCAAMVLMLGASPALAAAEPSNTPSISPRTVADMSCSLTRSGDTLKAYTTCLTNAPQAIVIYTTLQRYTGTAWVPVTSNTRSGQGVYLSLLTYPNPAHGFKYRLRADIATTALGQHTLYSDPIDW